MNNHVYRLHFSYIMTAMNDKENNTQKTGSPAQSYIDLATLLQKQRTPEKKLQIEKILTSDLPVHTMIEQIEHIDSDYTTLARPLPREGRPEDIEDSITNAGLISAETAERNRKKLKNKLKKNDTLSFLFVDFRKILRFIKNAGRKTDYICYSYFPPRIKMNRRIQYLFESVFQKQAGELYPVIGKVLKEGWLHLNKLDYNLIVQFGNLCGEILNFNIHVHDLNEENITDKISRLEYCFITCNYRHEHQAILAHSVSTVIERYPEWNIDPIMVKSSILRLLDNKQSRPSLQNFILAMNMITYKRYFRLEDLYQSSSMQIINTFDFECDIITSKRIKEYIEKTLQELLTQIKEKTEIDKLVRFLPVHHDGSFNYKVLEMFYEKSVPGINQVFAHDREYPALFAQNFFKLFLQMYEPVLTEKIELEDAGEVRIFNSSYFQIEAAKIHSLTEKLSKYAYAFEKLPEERYLTLESSKKAGTQTEVELIQIIKDFIATMKALADKLIDIERCHRPEYQEPTGGKDVPLEPPMLLKRIVRIPHWDGRVNSPRHLRGQQVMAILSDIITLSLIVIVFFNDREIPLLLAKKDRIHREIQGSRKTLERLTNIIELKRIEEKYGI